MTSFSANNRKAAKLTGEKVIEIRQKYALPGRQYTQDRLAREYQVSVNTIRNIVNGVTWQTLPVIASSAEEATAAKLSELRAQAMLDAGLMTSDPTPAKPQAEMPEILKPKDPDRYK
jgi:hypothetical protein